MLRLFSLLLIGWAGSGCLVSFDYSGTTFLCMGDDGECPDGQMCIDNRCQVPGTGGIDAGADADAMVDAIALTGNILTLTFDEPAERSNATDRAGARRDGKNVSGAYGDGIYGSGVTLDPIDLARVLVPGYTEIFTTRALTIELWVNRASASSAETLLSNEAAMPVTPTLHWAINASGQLDFAAGCDASVAQVTASSAVVPGGRWVHLAVALDGDDITFFVDGEPTDTMPFPRAACGGPGDALSVGRDTAGLAPLTGSVDELKLSDYAKSNPEIRASMRFDSTGLVNVCGDGLIEGSEVCDGTDICCDESTCSFAANASSCEGGAGACADGRCVIGGGATRDDLVVEYHFGEGIGTVVGDTGPAPALDLTIADELAVSWNVDGLELLDVVEVASVGPATKLHDAVQGAGAMTIEAWVTPANITQDGPARIVTVSSSTSVRNFTLGQDATTYVSRVSTNQTNANGQPAAITPPAEARTALDHIIAVYGANRSEVYVNGKLRASFPLPGGLGTWSASSRIGIGDEFGANRRDWLGTFHYLAIYSRAMSSAEAAGNFEAGVPSPP